MSTAFWVLTIILIVLVVLGIVLYFLGKRAEKQKATQDEMVANTAQSVSMLIIDKRKMKLKESGLPEMVIKQTPWYLRNSKAPIVKAKVGPQILTLMCAPEIYDDVPVKKEVKATVSGLYLVSVKGLHGKKESNAKPVKKSWYRRLVDKSNQLSNVSKK